VKKFITLVTFLTFFFSAIPGRCEGLTVPAVPSAEPDPGAVTTPMKKGEPAPYTGVLLSPKAVASIIVQLNSSKDQVKIEVDKAKAEAAAQSQFKLVELQATTDAEKKILSASIVAKEKEIAALNEEIRKQSSSSSNPMLWAAGGFAGGAVFTVLTVFALSHATK